jgi:hypothetical protein
MFHCLPLNVMVEWLILLLCVRLSGPGSITQACEDFAARIIGEMGYIKCRDSKNVNGFYVSCTDFLQFHIYVIS